MPHRLRNLVSATLAERGVYFLPWTGTNGERYLAAIDRRGCRVAEAILFTDIDSRPIERVLWEVLDKADPVPHLELLS